MEKEYYHVYNRGADKRCIFEEREDALRFLQTMKEFNTTKPLGGIYAISKSKLKKEKVRHRMSNLVSIVAYRLNQNHFHMIISPLVENGIRKFMQRISNGYTKYFNVKYKRSGVLFQGKYKRKLIETDEYLLHLSCYVNLNDMVHKGMNRDWLCESRFSSFTQYIKGGLHKGVRCDVAIVLEQYRDSKAYEIQSFERLKDILERKKNEKELARALID